MYLQPGSTTYDLLQVLCITFAQECPLYTKSASTGFNQSHPVHNKVASPVTYPTFPIQKPTVPCIPSAGNHATVSHGTCLPSAVMMGPASTVANRTFSEYKATQVLKMSQSFELKEFYRNFSYSFLIPSAY